MKIIHYPDPILLKPCEPINKFDDSLHKTLDEMKILMIQSNGIGLAANQVGISKSFFIIKDNKGDIVEFINPKIIDSEGTVNVNEGCLSAPGIYLPVSRPEAILIEYQDRTGEQKRSVAEGIEARVILHEYDHLLGIFYFSKVNRAVRKQALSKLRKTK